MVNRMLLRVYLILIISLVLQGVYGKIVAYPHGYIGQKLILHGVYFCIFALCGLDGVAIR